MTEITFQKIIRETNDADLLTAVDTAIAKREITGAELDAVIERRVLAKMKDGPGYHREYTRLIADGADYVGNQIWRKRKAIGGLEPHQVAIIKAMDEPLKKRNPADVDDTPLSELQKLAEAVRKAEPHLSPESAFTKALTSAQGQRLYAEDKARRLGVAA